MISRHLLKDFYLELTQGDPAQALDWVLAKIYDEVGDLIPDKDARPEDLAAYVPVHDWDEPAVDAKGIGAAERACDKRREDASRERARAYEARRKEREAA